MGRRIAFSALLCVVVLALPGCGTPRGGNTADGPDSGPRRGGVVVLGSITDVDSWNEYLSRQSFANYMLRRIYLRLAREIGESYEPSLAESWEPAEDGLSILFRLRESVWSDGTPVTADDVRFTWQAQTSPDVPWVNAQIKQQITDVEVVDPRTVVFHFARRYPDQLTDAVDGGILPAHVFGQVPFADWATHDWSEIRIGSGPFVLVRHNVGNEIVLERNPRYFDSELPYLDRVVVRIVPDVLSLTTQLRSGEIDLLHDVPPREADRLARASGSGIRVLEYSLPRYDYLGWNCSQAPFDDPMVRRAVTLAIDRAALVDELLYGYGAVGCRPVPSDWWGAVSDLEPWEHDPDEARRLLRERGFSTVDASGVEIPGERTLSLDLITNSGNQLRSDILVKIQEQLSRVGVRAEVRSMEQRALIQQVSRGDFDGYLGGWNFSGKIPLDSLFGSAAWPPDGFNVVRYRSDEVDAELERLQLAEDRRAMRPALDAIQRRIHEDQPYTFLYERAGAAGHGPRLHGVRIDVPTDPLDGLERFWVSGEL